MDCVPKRHSPVRSGCKSKDCSPKMHFGNSYQNCTYMVILGCESRASVPKMHPNYTYTVISGCKSRASVLKLHPNLSGASEGDEIVVSWQGDGRLLTNLETREANKQDGKPKKRSVRHADDMLGKSKHFTLYMVELPQERKSCRRYHHLPMPVHQIKLRWRMYCHPVKNVLIKL